MSHRTTLTAHIPEKTTQILTFTVKDENGAAIAGSSLTTATLTLYDVRTEQIINSRNQVDIKSLIDGSGVGTFTLTPSDTVIQTPTQSTEDHVALIEFTYAAGAKAGKHEVLHTVTNLAKVS